MNSTERAFLRADTASNAEALGNEGNLGIGVHFNAELASAHHRARLLALLSTFLHSLFCQSGPPKKDVGQQGVDIYLRFALYISL